MNKAFGECHNGWFSTTLCAPVFEQPRSFPQYIGGREYVEWAQTAYHQKYDGGCKNDGFKTVSASHKYGYGGGVCGLASATTQEKPADDAVAPRLIEPSCCDDAERWACQQGGGDWLDSSCKPCPIRRFA